MPNYLNDWKELPVGILIKDGTMTYEWGGFNELDNTGWMTQPNDPRISKAMIGHVTDKEWHEKTPVVIDKKAQLDSEIASFKRALKKLNLPPPTFEGRVSVVEYLIDWDYSPNFHAFAVLEGDTFIRYTYDIGDKFISGKDKNAKSFKVPDDLIDYLKQIKF